MSSGGGVRRAFGAVLLVGGALVVATGVVARTRSHAEVRPGLVAATAALRGRVDSAIAAEGRALEPKAATAARLSEIVSGLDIDADPHTFEDLLENEDWWAPYRTDFALSGVVNGSGTLAMIGAGAGDVAATPVVRQAREIGVASGLVGLKGRPYLLAAARVPRGKRAVSGAVVVLGALFDQKALAAASEATAAPLGVSDGKRLVFAAGTEPAQMALSALLGREPSAGDQGLLLVDEGRSGAAWPLDKGLWLLGLLPAPAAPPGPKLGTFVLAGGALLFLVGVILLLSARRAAHRVDSNDPLVITRPFGSGPKPDLAHLRPTHRTQDLRAPMPGAGVGFGVGVPQAYALGANVVAAPGSAAIAAPHAAVGGALAATFDAAAASAAAAPLASSPAVETPPGGAGITLGRYRLLERIGEGGMAEIFIAAAHGAEGFVRHFVVKRMHPHLARSRDAVNQFIDEARLQSGLVHSNIVPVFDFGRAGEEYFLALEYIHGRDLERLVRRHVEVFGRSLSVPVAFYVMHEVLEALAYAHGRTDAEGRNVGIVHRDISPGNVLISLRGEVKLSDFGIAKAEGRMSRTEVGLIKGNVSFMSPEQARGEPVDHRSDLFSAAVVLYYCLTAQFLYHDETMFNRLVRAAMGPAMSEFTQLDTLPPVAADVLRRALSLDPSKRYQSAREFARDLAGHFTAGRNELGDLMDSLFPELRREER
jgi:hypothetical protein